MPLYICPLVHHYVKRDITMGSLQQLRLLVPCLMAIPLSILHPFNTSNAVSSLSRLRCHSLVLIRCRVTTNISDSVKRKADVFDRRLHWCPGCNMTCRIVQTSTELQHSSSPVSIAEASHHARTLARTGYGAGMAFLDSCAICQSNTRFL